MKFYFDKDNKIKFKISKRQKGTLKSSIRAFEAGIEHSSNLSDDEKKSELAKYVANNFLDDESKKIAASSYWRFIYQLKKFLDMN